MKIFMAVLTLCFSFPLYAYLLYKILAHIDASELMWFLFYAYVPTSFLSSLLWRLYDEGSEKS